MSPVLEASQIATFNVDSMPRWLPNFGRVEAFYSQCMSSDIPGSRFLVQTYSKPVRLSNFYSITFPWMVGFTGLSV